MLARKINLSVGHYQNIEYGSTKPNVYIAMKLAKALNSTPEELFPFPNDNSSDESK